MATATGTFAACEALSRGVYRMDWSSDSGVTGVGNPFVGAHLPDKTVALYGPTGGTSQIIIEGTNGSVVSTATWVTLSTPSLGDLDFTNVTGGKMLIVRENPFMIRPRFAVVTTGKVLNAVIVARGGK